MIIQFKNKMNSNFEFKHYGIVANEIITLRDLRVAPWKATGDSKVGGIPAKCPIVVEMLRQFSSKLNNAMTCSSLWTRTVDEGFWSILMAFAVFLKNINEIKQNYLILSQKLLWTYTLLWAELSFLISATPTPMLCSHSSSPSSSTSSSISSSPSSLLPGQSLDSWVSYPWSVGDVFTDEVPEVDSLCSGNVNAISTEKINI